jgi:hypothetical protein
MLEVIIRKAEEIFPEAVFAVHLDHGDEATCYDCIDSGFYSSVMIDASHEPFEENVAVTKRVVEKAHSVPEEEVRRINAAGGKLDPSAVPARGAPGGNQNQHRYRRKGSSGLVSIENFSATTPNSSISDRLAKPLSKNTPSLSPARTKTWFGRQLSSIRQSLVKRS